jgi:hypothetical protein
MESHGLTGIIMSVIGRLPLLAVVLQPEESSQQT